MPEATENLRITLKLEGLPEEDGHVRFSDLLDELQALKETLDNVDKMVGQTSGTVLYYRVIDLKHSSPATVVLEPRIKPKKRRLPNDAISIRHHRFFQELDAIENRKPVSEDLDTKTLLSFKKLVDGVGRTFLKASISNSVSSIPLTEGLRQKVDILIEKEHRSRGSIAGRLEALNVHKNTNTFWIYPSVGPRKVLCKFQSSDREKVKECIDKIVRVHGVKFFRPNANGPHRIVVDTFEVDPQSNVSLADIGGIAPRATGDESSVDFMRRHRNEWQ
jgi:hypothetical protein